MDESEGDEISLSFVFRSAIMACENNFKTLLLRKKKVLPNVKRKDFFHALIKNRIIIGKLLVLFRSLENYEKSKRYSKVTEKNDNNLVIKKLKNIKNFFSSVDLSTNSALTIRNIIDGAPLNYKKTKKGSEFKFNMSFNYFYNQRNIRAYKFIRFRKKYVFIQNPGYFTATLRINDDNTSSICNCSTLFTVNINSQKDVLKSIMKEILTFNPSDSSFTHPFERKALMFSIVQFYITYAQQFKKHISQFNAELLKKNNLLYIIFPKTFNIDVEFRLEIIEFHVYLTSTHPVYQPPKDYTKIRETIDQRITQLTTLAYCVDKTFFVRKIDPSTNILQLLSEIRDIYFYTAIKERWNEIALFLMNMFSFRFPCYFFCKGPTISQTYIRFGSIQKPILYYTIDAKTGQQCIIVQDRIIPLPEHINIPFLTFGFLYDFAKDVVDIMLYDRKGATNILFSHLSFGMFDYYQSCAEDFKIQLKQTRIIPKFKIVSNDGKLVYSTAKLEELYCAPEMRQVLYFTQDIFRDVKINLIIHQISKLLKDQGFNIYQTQKEIYIIKPFLITAIFKIHSSYYWSLKIRYLTYIPNEERPVVVFTGNSITCRFCRQLVRLISSVTAYLDIKHHFENTLALYQGIIKLNILSPTFIQVNVNNDYSLHFGFPSYTNTMMYESSNIIQVSSLFAQKLILRFPHILSLQNWDNFIIIPSIYNGLGSFISSVLPFVMEFKSIFLSNNYWTFTLNQSFSDAVLIFQGLMSILVQIKPKRLLLCRFSARGASSFLVHILKILGINVEDRRIFYIFKSTLSQFKSIKTKIEENYNLFMKLKEMTLYSFKVQGDQLVATSYDKNVWMIMKTKNYVMQFKKSQIASELSRKIASLQNLSVDQKIEMNRFFYMLMHQVFGETALILLQVLPVNDVNWLEIKNNSYIGRDKAIFKITGISEGRTICISITNGHIFSQDQKKRVTPTDLRIIMNPNNTNLQTLFKLFQ